MHTCKAVCFKMLKLKVCNYQLHSKSSQSRLAWPHVQGQQQQRVPLCTPVGPLAAHASASASSPSKLDPLDYTQVVALTSELRQWIPSKVQRVQLADPHTLALYIRAVDRQGWLHLSWHPRAARVCLGDEPELGDASSLYPFATLVRTKCDALS